MCLCVETDTLVNACVLTNTPLKKGDCIQTKRGHTVPPACRCIVQPRHAPTMGEILNEFTETAAKPRCCSLMTYGPLQGPELSELNRTVRTLHELSVKHNANISHLHVNVFLLLQSLRFEFIY